ncbi:lipoyl(octanoyl) transferase LipB [Neoactinobaculum massilliense]|uniref:lipoyl(octanoyl) transferase LipB n=1 Tax=Neoactinobaculum massilliense TaxID=2364794 RepID=UPI000F523DAD|nr:lipoyl(octanoyl) transferase LipB [Neoactinobaculum massilliense]
MQLVNLLGRGPLPYLEMDHFQRLLHNEVAAGRTDDSLVVWQAQPVYTAGRNTEPEDIPDRSVPAVSVDRGGSVTYHGPGQLIIYPIVRVPGQVDIVAWIKATEYALIDATATLGIHTEIVMHRVGVWYRQPGQMDRKLCAIGMKFADHTSMHGMAYNVTTNLSAFGAVVPCGLPDAGVTSLEELGHTMSLNGAARLLVPHLVRAYLPFTGADQSVSEAASYSVADADALWTRLQADPEELKLPPRTGSLWVSRNK